MIQPDQVLPCGCVIRCALAQGIRVTTYIPCNEDCVNYRNMLDEAQSQNKPIEYKEGP